MRLWANVQGQQATAARLLLGYTTIVSLEICPQEYPEYSVNIYKSTCMYCHCSMENFIWPTLRAVCVVVCWLNSSIVVLNAVMCLLCCVFIHVVRIWG